MLVGRAGVGAGVGVVGWLDLESQMTQRMMVVSRIATQRAMAFLVFMGRACLVDGQASASRLPIGWWDTLARARCSAGNAG